MMIPLLIGITLISFVVIHLAPGEPTDMQTQLNPEVSTELRDRLRDQYGLDKPLVIQYGDGWDGLCASILVIPFPRIAVPSLTRLLNGCR